MCYKCRKNPQNRNTRYCDDWWDDIPHGGYNADRRLKKKIYERLDKESEKDKREDLLPPT